MKAVKTLAAINAALENDQERQHRNHLGASILGRPCARQIWYTWRWAGKELFSGRMLRLFDRGHREEERFIAYLRRIGCEVWPVNPETGEQWRITFASGHGGGSSDGVGRGIPDLPPDVPFLLEFKTHNDKSFKALERQGICQSKPEHFAQMQIYMVKMELPAGVYFAVNKNDDGIHSEVVFPNVSYANNLIDKGERIVESEVAPPKIDKSPGYYLCRFCFFKDICHDQVLPEINCRTCEFSKPIPDGQWLCGKYNWTLTSDQQRMGCAEYKLKPGYIGE